MDAIVGGPGTGCRNGSIGCLFWLPNSDLDSEGRPPIVCVRTMVDTGAVAAAASIPGRDIVATVACAVGTRAAATSTATIFSGDAQPKIVDDAVARVRPLMGAGHRMLQAVTMGLMRTYQGINARYYANRQAMAEKRRAEAKTIDDDARARAINGGTDAKDEANKRAARRQLEQYVGKEGDTLCDGRYKVVRKLGSGAFATVVECIDQSQSPTVQCPPVFCSPYLTCSISIGRRAGGSCGDQGDSRKFRL